MAHAAAAVVWIAEEAANHGNNNFAVIRPAEWQSLELPFRVFIFENTVGGKRTTWLPTLVRQTRCSWLRCDGDADDHQAPVSVEASALLKSDGGCILIITRGLLHLGNSSATNYSFVLFLLLVFLDSLLVFWRIVSSLPRTRIPYYDHLVKNKLSIERALLAALTHLHVIDLKSYIVLVLIPSHR